MLAVYASGLAILLSFTVGLLLVQGSGGLTSKSARFNLGLGLISSALFALIFSSLATWVLDRNQRSSTAETLQAGVDEILANVAQLHRTYLPVANFPAAEKFNEAYNRELMRSIESSSIYDFCGPSARFVAARLRLVRHCPQQIRISMIDPAIDSAIVRRAADRQRWASSAGKGIIDLEREVRDELRMSIVSLFDFRTTNPVSIVYTGDLVVYRMELTESSVFFSWYHGAASSGKEMPEAVQFSHDSLYYQVLRQDMTRRFEILQRKVLFDSRTTEHDLVNHLRDMTGTSYSLADINGIRRDYASHTKNFVDFMKRQGY